MSKISYASAIGSLMYAILCTRSDIAHAVSVTSRYQSNPGEEYWTSVKCILKYLRRTKDIVFENGELQVQRLTDSDFISNINDRKSTSGSLFICNGGAVSWKSSKQMVIADSTIEAEYIAASKAVKEVFWYKKFATELGVMSSDAIPLYCDNNGAIALAMEPRSHQKSKHIERRFHLIHDYLEKDYAEVKRVDSTDNVADPLTKPLGQQKIEAHFKKMGLRYVANWH